ncbi:MAG: M56 family metallopeptidase [Sarcina sp.]
MVFKFVLETAMTGSIVIIFIIIMQKILKDKITPSFSYYLWIVVFIKFLIPLDIKSPFSLQRLIPNLRFQKQINLNVTNVIFENIKSVEMNSVETSISLGEIWFIGVIVCLAYYMMKYLILQKKFKKCNKVCKKDVLEVLERCKKTLKISKNIEILESEFLSSPAITGFWKTKILVPKKFLDNNSSEDIELIFVHELMHLKYGDILLNLFLDVMKIIYFFNPLIYIASRKVKNDCEIACDYRVLKIVGVKFYKTYGNILIDLASNSKINTKFEFGFNAMGNKRELERRIIMIGKNNKFGKKHIVAGISTLALVGAVGLTTYADNNGEVDKRDNIIEKFEGENIKNINKGEKVLDKRAKVKIDTTTGEVLAIDSEKIDTEDTNLNIGSGINIIVDKGAENISIQQVKSHIENMLKESMQEGKVENLVKDKNNFTYDIVKADGTRIKAEVGIIVINSAE